MTIATPAAQVSPAVLVVMGVSGSGKTTVGTLLARRLGWRFADADEFHNAANVAKMASGVPLDDADRAPWLQAIAARIDLWLREQQRGVITCSALRRRYREVISGGRPQVRLVYLKGDLAIIAGRLAARRGHFMPASLLDSQLEALEEPTPAEQAITVSIDRPPAGVVDQIIAAAFAGLTATPLIERDSP